MVIARLYVVELIHIMFFFDNHVRGINIIVGRIIFNILISLGFVRDRVHMYWKLLLVMINQVLLHRLQIPVK